MNVLPYVLLASGLVACSEVMALYEWQDQDSQGNARILLRAFSVATEQGNDTDETAGGLARLHLQNKYKSGIGYELNIYQTLMDKSLAGSQSNALSGGVERSGYFEWSLSDTEYAHLAIDQMSFYVRGEQYNIGIGRQAINLAATFFFMPNDFFAPFSAQTFYRIYKPGVDSLSVEWSPGELDSVSFFTVAGYTKSDKTDSGWSEGVDSRRNSYLLRYLNNYAGFEWGLIAGKVRRERIIGGSLTGELFGWLGVRVEGHQAEEIDYPANRFNMLSIGLEHRWQNSLMLQIEQFYNGSGVITPSTYDFAKPYPARRYQALGLSYELTPLLNGQISIIRNQIDGSLLYNLNGIYSLSDESELSFSLSMPGHISHDDDYSEQREFSRYPDTISLEIRSYY